MVGMEDGMEAMGIELGQQSRLPHAHPQHTRRPLRTWELTANTLRSSALSSASASAARTVFSLSSLLRAAGRVCWWLLNEALPFFDPSDLVHLI